MLDDNPIISSMKQQAIKSLIINQFKFIIYKRFKFTNSFIKCLNICDDRISNNYAK
jgi:hypothetical protein